jgi:hypothetical protein
MMGVVSPRATAYGEGVRARPVGSVSSGALDAVTESRSDEEARRTDGSQSVA